MQTKQAKRLSMSSKSQCKGTLYILTCKSCLEPALRLNMHSYFIFRGCEPRHHTERTLSNMSCLMTKPTKLPLCPAKTLISWASAQSDQSLRCPHKETLGPQLPTECIAKTLIRLGGCPCWSESSLGAQIILLVLSWGGSYGPLNAVRNLSLCSKEKLSLPFYMSSSLNRIRFIKHQ